MKQGDAKTMAIVLDGLDNYDVESIRIIFKQYEKQDAAILKEATWNSDGSGNMERVGNVLKIFWSMEDTFLFKSNQTFFADYQIKLHNSNEMPSVDQTAIKMTNTIFSEEEALG